MYIDHYSIFGAVYYEWEGWKKLKFIAALVSVSSLSPLWGSCAEGMRQSRGFSLIVQVKHWRLIELARVTQLSAKVRLEPRFSAFSILVHVTSQ